MSSNSNNQQNDPFDPEILLRSAEDPIGFLKEVSGSISTIRCAAEQQLDEWVENGWVTKEQGSELIRKHRPRKGPVHKLVSDDFWHEIKWYLAYQDKFPPLEN